MLPGWREANGGDKNLHVKDGINWDSTKLVHHREDDSYWCSTLNTITPWFGPYKTFEEAAAIATLL